MARTGPAGEDGIAARIAAARRQIERQRFAGEDPVVDLPPRLGRADLAARVLAAERAGALVALDGERFNPREDLAEAALRDAIDALRSWRFAAARARLAEASERAHAPVLQQRVALFKALTRLLAALIYTPLDEKPRGGTLAGLDEVLAGLDHLSENERLHYRDEADRLLNLRESAAGGDPFLTAAWTLIRAQLALSGGQDEGALVWLLRLAAQTGAGQTAAGANAAYLSDLLQRARTHILTLIGDTGAAAAAAEATPAPAGDTAIQPRDLANALVAHLSATFGRDLARGTELFALNEYIDAGVATRAPSRAPSSRRGVQLNAQQPSPE